MYIRPPDSIRQRIHIPDNYSGNAFRERGAQESGYSSKSYNDMPPPLRLDTPPSERSDEKIRPQKSSDEDNDFDSFSEDDHSNPTLPDKNFEGNEVQSVSVEENSEKKQNTSLFSSIFPPSMSDSSRFPFGHGIGSEEILILTTMLLIYVSGLNDGKTDNEFMLLLGLLLFAG